MQSLKSDTQPGPLVPNIAEMLKRNAERFSEQTAYQEKRNGRYWGITWKDFYEDILNIAANLRNYGFGAGDKMVLFSPNRLEMLEMEMAVMASGGISVPIFSNFIQKTAELLIRHSDARFLSLAGNRQLSRVGEDLPLEQVFVFDDSVRGNRNNLTPFSKLLHKADEQEYSLATATQPDEICLNMYTSGTMGTPKCVQLTHGNILSQQAALDALPWWSVDETDRFLSYLPWHHSFGGIFEKFNALYRGAALSLESSYGKDTSEIFENWKQVQPTVFFSIPKVYRELVEMTHHDREAERLFFHSGLKFIFTAAAPLPAKLSEEFERRNIPVIEGWGLTETSPCCTLTDPKLKRAPGVVGKPIPGVELHLDDDGEILVKGPNVMTAYYKNDLANKDTFTDKGWFRTGDVGELTEGGLKIVSRKDRIFKLLNGEKVIPTELEKLIEKKCHYIQFAMIAGAGEEYPVALLFPNKRLMERPDYAMSPMEGCLCPRSLDELSKCLHGCLRDVNTELNQKFARIRSAMVLNDELSVEKSTLTPSMKVAPNNVLNAYKVHLASLYENDIDMDDNVYVIELDKQEHYNQTKGIK